jgi:UDP-N-acetylmuramoylalanine--D-glutamate ligase
MYKRIIDKLKNKNVAILGFGKEGMSTYKFIRRHLDQKLTIIDKNELIKENEIFLNDKNVEFVLGDNYLDNLDKYDIIIKSAGVCLKDIDTSKIIDKLTSQYGLLLEDTDLFTIGITASKGKTTTTTLTYEVIKNQFDNVYLLGNMGNPVLDQIENFNKDSILVIELAALQLQYVKASPNISCILNLFEEHLDYFSDKDKYYKAKLNIFKYQNSSDYSLYFKDNDTLNEYVGNIALNSNLISISFNQGDIYCKDNLIYYKDDVLYKDDSKRKLLGKHNLENIMFVLGICKILNLDINKASKVINDFNPLEHRMEYVGTFNNIKFYNDAIATIPYATINCIEALKDVDTLIFGGMDRGISYDDFIEYLNKSNISNFICMPDTGYKIGKLLKNKNVYFIEDLKEAVNKAYEVTKKGSSCVLSPAASSYNKFKNFEQKGSLYKEYIKNK